MKTKARRPKVLPEELFRQKGKVYDIGCGSRPYPGSIGVDIVPLPEVDIVADLAGRWPFEDGSIDCLIATHVLEHLDLLPAMDEAFRVLRPGGYFWIRVPHSSFRDFWRDPTHRRPFTIRTFDYWDPGRPGYVPDYGLRASFEVCHRALHWYGYLEQHRFRPALSWFAEPMRRFVDVLANSNHFLCERFWSGAVGGFAEAEFVLRKPLENGDAAKS